MVIFSTHPIPSMVARLYIYLHGWLMLMVNVGRYTIHGCYGQFHPAIFETRDPQWTWSTVPDTFTFNRQPQQHVNFPRKPATSVNIVLISWSPFDHQKTSRLITVFGLWKSHLMDLKRSINEPLFKNLSPSSPPGFPRCGCDELGTFRIGGFLGYSLVFKYPCSKLR